MIARVVHRITLAVLGFSALQLFAQSPFQFPTANHALYDVGGQTRFFAPTAPNHSWTSGSFGCVRSDGWQFHEGLDIRSIQHDKHGEPTDPVMSTADGTVMYANHRAGLSNYGKYIVIRHFIDGIEVYSLYAHLSAIAPGIVYGKKVHGGDVIGTMGRTANTRTPIAKYRAHVHFELDLLDNAHFSQWFKKHLPGERNDHGVWNGLNLTGLDPREILLQEHRPTREFNLLTFIRSQTALCRVLVRATNFPYLKRYPLLVLKNPVAEKEGVAGYEIALNYSGLAFALMPRAASEIKGSEKIQLLSVNEAEYHANPCRKLVVKRGGHWHLTENGRREIELLTYQ